MKQGSTKDLTELVQEVDRQARVKRDFKAKQNRLLLQTVPGNDGASVLTIGTNGDSVGDFRVNDHAHNQLSDRLQIPKRYYDRLRNDAPALLDENVNHWFASSDEKRMIRTLDGKARAFLSDRYRPIDNWDLMKVITDVLTSDEVAELGVDIRSCDITETNLYLKAICPNIEAEIVTERRGKKVGDVVRAGFMAGNSEVGCGSFFIGEFAEVYTCTNGMVGQRTLTKYHVGRGDDNDETREWIKDETRIAEDKAFFLRVRDTVTGMLSQTSFDKIVAKWQQAADTKIEADIEEVLNGFQHRFGWDRDERGSVMRHLIEGGSLNQWGMANAVTRAAADLESYDRATQFEKDGTDIIELPRKAWDEIPTAKAPKAQAA